MPAGATLGIAQGHCHTAGAFLASSHLSTGHSPFCSTPWGRWGLLTNACPIQPSSQVGLSGRSHQCGTGVWNILLHLDMS